MEILQTAAALHARTVEWRRAGRRIGLVPTMGALHAGHLQLVQAAVAQNDAVVVSLFVNPTQFNNPDDFRRYPRLPEADAALLAPTGCAVLFQPAVEELYPTPPLTRFDFGPLEHVMEGAHRPGHFSGVATVVSKLFHLAQPSPRLLRPEGLAAGRHHPPAGRRPVVSAGAGGVPDRARGRRAGPVVAQPSG